MVARNYLLESFVHGVKIFDARSTESASCTLNEILATFRGEIGSGIRLLETGKPAAVRTRGRGARRAFATKRRGRATAISAIVDPPGPQCQEKSPFPRGLSRDTNLYEVTGHELLRVEPFVPDHPERLLSFP
jgi:hypothetical protein